MHPRKQPNPRIRKAPQFRSDANRKADQGTGGRVVRRVTIAQVAEEAGVSAMTVSNVLNGKPGAAEDTRRRVLEVAGRLGYQPNVSARNLRAGRSGLIGVMALDLTNQYGLEIVRGVADALAEAERELLINATYQDAIRERERIEFLGRGLVDGVLLVAPVLEGQALEALARANLPCVIIDPRRLDVPFPRVTVDNYHGMRAAAQHLLDLGHTKIAYICGEPDMESTAVRFQGYSDAMRLAGVEVDERLVAACDFSYACGFRTATRLIADHRPTALIGGADLIALGAVDAARAHGLHVPGDFSVIGFDDLPQAAQSFPGLTTVRQPLHDMGVTAARALLTLVDGQQLLLEDMRLPTELMKRGSTAAPRTPVAPGAPGVGRPGQITFPGDGPDVLLHQTRRRSARTAGGSTRSMRGARCCAAPSAPGFCGSRSSARDLMASSICLPPTAGRARASCSPRQPICASGQRSRLSASWPA
jgi:LacI family transcriptional regulator